MNLRYRLHHTILENDAEFQEIYQAYLCADAKFRLLLQELKPEQQDIIHEYCGTLAELQMRELELALMRQV